MFFFRITTIFASKRYVMTNEYYKLEEENRRLQSINTLLTERIEALENLTEELQHQNKTFIDELNYYEEIFSFLPQINENNARLFENKNQIKYKMVTVLYVVIKDLSGFHESDVNENRLIDDLDRIFFQFDHITSQFGLEKISSIGDTYICAGGLPKKNRTNSIEVVLAAMEMQSFVQKSAEKIGKKLWDISFGVHTGPVMASFTGTKKKAYQLKGDAVNISSRIGVANKTNEIYISEVTFEFVRDLFNCNYVGKLPFKFKGDIPIYQVKGFRPEYSATDNHQKPNADFRIQYQLLKYEDLNDLILDKLERELPKHLYYHNLKHTIDVTIGVEIIGRGENVSQEDILLLKTAALFHDVGQINGAKNHEQKSVTLAKRILPEYGYSQKQIDQIEQLIMATAFPPSPRNILEKIMCDADLDYLGRDDFIPISNDLYKELKVQNLIGSEKDWNLKQLHFIQNHQYYTNTALILREVKKEQQIKRLQKLIEEAS